LLSSKSNSSCTAIDVVGQFNLHSAAISGIPDNYQVLFLQGGASSQFAVIPMNLLRGKKTADYVRTGIWSHKAVEQAF